MIKFYYHPSPNPATVALFLEESGLPYELMPVDTRKGEQFKPAFLAINPNGKTPAIVDGDVTVFDSNAILLYLAEMTGKFLPDATPALRGELLRGHRIALHDHVERGFQPDGARKSLRAAGSGQQPDLHLGQRHLRAGRGHSEGAAERELEAAAEGGAVQRGDDGLGARLARGDKRPQRGLGHHRRRVELADVGAARELLARPREHDRVDA